MANFFLIDHSLQRPGGHHADYSICVARAANEMGFHTTVGTNARLQALPELEAYAHVLRSFRQTTYQKDSYLHGLKQLTRCKHDFTGRQNTEPRFLTRISHIFRHFQHQSRRRRFIRQFAEDCRTFFAPAIFNDGDHAFFTTVSELELLGLTQFLANHPRTLQMHWHLQFHFNLFEGRTPEYDAQEELSRTLQTCFCEALGRVPMHAIHFYATSETLAEQYNRLGIGDFETLPYPISPAFEIPSPQETDPGGFELEWVSKRPLRITCPGEIRREKGHVEYLQPLVDRIWQPHLSSGNVKLVLQRPKRKWPAPEKIQLAAPVTGSTSTAAQALDLGDCIEYLPHPLENQQYVNLIKSADCGLLFYDSRTYFSRRAGVLGELLSCGKPVIVPAGSWLAEQIQTPMQQHLNRTAASSSVVRRLDQTLLNWNHNNVPHAGGIVSFDQLKNPFTFDFETAIHESGFLLEFDWHWPAMPGVFCRVEVDQYCGSNSLIESGVQVVGQSRSGPQTTVLFRCHGEADRIQVRLKNAFHNSTASIRSLRVSMLDENPQRLPLSSVGIIAVDQDDLPNCIDELVAYYPHYRSTARTFARQWYSRHSPKRTVAHLISTEKSWREAA